VSGGQISGSAAAAWRFSKLTASTRSTTFADVLARIADHPARQIAA